MIQRGNSFISFPTNVTPVVVSNIKYGRLYNLYAEIDVNFAPVGWHVPSQTEFEILIVELGGSSIAGGTMKETGIVYWDSPNEGASNESGMNVRGSGIRNVDEILPEPIMSFQALKLGSALWGTTFIENDGFGDLYYSVWLNNGDEIAYSQAGYKMAGNPVRLIKDNSILVPSLTDLDGNTYRTTKIGNQVWLADNWACTKLNDGTSIPNVTDNTAWGALTTGAYCNYNNDISNVFLP